MERLLINSKYAERLLFVIGLLVVILYSAIFMLSPLNGEDYALTRHFGNYGFFYRIEWIINRSIEQAISWNARLGEQLAIFWLSMPKIYFVVISTVVFVLFNFLAATTISGTDNALIKTILAISIVFFAWPALEIFFWGTVNAGYMHPLVLILSCIYLYRSDSAVEKIAQSKYLVILVSIIAFLAGISFENTPVAVMFYMSMSLLLARRNVGIWRGLVPIFSMALGWILLILAPSTQHRRDYYNNVFGIAEYSMDYLATRTIDVLKVFFEISWPLLFLTIVSLFIVFWFSLDKRRITLALVTTLLVIASVVAAPYTEPRAFSLAWALMFSLSMAGIIILINRLHQHQLLIMSIIGLLLYFPLKAGALYFDFAEKVNERDFYIRRMSKTQACVDGIEVGTIREQYPYKYLNNRDEWYRANPGFISKYYQCKIVIR